MTTRLAVVQRAAPVAACALLVCACAPAMPVTAPLPDPGAFARYPLVPWPATLRARSGEFRIGPNTRVTLSDPTSAELRNVATFLTDYIRAATNIAVTNSETAARPGAAGTIALVLTDDGEAESYRLSVTPASVTVSARTARGLFHGVQTLRQLLPPVTAAAAIPAVEIEDAPRFSYRGMHLDVGRHFFPVAFVKKYIDLLALYKFNTLHWHLTEDQGWRVEIKRYPRLTEIGGCRKETRVGHGGRRPAVYDGTPYCGFYTQDEIRDVVAYATARHVTILPEIELPGHSRAALAAYPELACTPGPFEVATTWGVFEEIYCPKEETFTFLEGVLTEVMQLFPSEYIHIGGDEAPKKAWQESAVAQAVIRREGLKDEHELQSWFIRRIERFLNSNGRKLIGWDEIVEGGLSPTATVMYWRDRDPATEAARLADDPARVAARSGNHVIMTPNSRFYLDHYQAPPAGEPLAIGGDSPLEKVYAYDPVPSDFTPEMARQVLGAQGNVWTEYMRTSDHVEYMAFPRLLAVAEVVWSPQQARNFDGFVRRLPAQLRLLSALGVKYRAPRPGEPGGGAAPDSAPSQPPTAAIRYNQLGYLPDQAKVAVLCVREGALPTSFRVRDENGGIVLPPAPVRDAGAFGPCVATGRLDFSAITREARYRIEAGDAPTVTVRVSADAYRGAADTLLAYLRQQRSLFNPLFRDSVHHRTDGILVDHPDEGAFIPVAGGWADAADYLQYVTTSATATFALLAAHRDHAGAFGDAHGANGLPGANGAADVLDEARWGLEWLMRMHPRPDLILNQLGDDRDHAFLDLPTTDSSDYGWGKRGFRPVYPCTGRAQGLFQHRNRSDGIASTAGKMAAAFALGALTFRARDVALADTLARKAHTAYQLGRAHPGVCQTAPARQPYFYEEANWVDDMELAAAQLHALTGESRYLNEAVEYAAREPVTPWMGRDTARHYEFYPWHNYGHYEIWRTSNDATAKQRMSSYYRAGLAAVVARANHGFRIGVPFIWCSNDLVVAFATQAWLYRRMTGDTTYTSYERAAVDWLFGANPWGTSMVIGLPRDGDYPIDPHSVVGKQLGHETQRGGLVDGPVYRSIFEKLLYVNLHEPDEYAAWNTGRVVYHDDWGDYSTNEPIMDGTAALVYILAALADRTR